eukprot:2611361-Alexandrium_andersonii.AAC.1
MREPRTTSTKLRQSRRRRLRRATDAPEAWGLSLARRVPAGAERQEGARRSCGATQGTRLLRRPPHPNYDSASCARSRGGCSG